MRSIERVLHIEGRSASHTVRDGVRGQQPQNPTSSSPSPLPTVRILQATVSTSQQFTIATDTTKTSDPTMPATMSKPATVSQEAHGLSPKSIAGLAMIPVAVVLIAVAIFTCFWLRKRRRRAPIIHHLGPTPPPLPAVPEKDFRSPNSSFESTASGGKVRTLSAMSIPVMHTGWIAPPRPQARPSHDSAVHHNPWNDRFLRISTDIATAGFQVPRGAIEAGIDSPIERSSPFRLKRGDTRKRSSLDPDVMSAWPAPPQPAAQPAPLKIPRCGRTYMERRSISAEYFSQERDSRDVHGLQEYWEEFRLNLGPDPGPTVRSH